MNSITSVFVVSPLSYRDAQLDEAFGDHHMQCEAFQFDVCWIDMGIGQAHRFEAIIEKDVASNSDLNQHSSYFDFE